MKCRFFSSACCLLFLLTMLTSFSHAAQRDPVNADILLERGLIFDGSGGKATVGDVAIQNDRIVAVGRFEAGDVRRVIDCRGLAVAPGFIDLHNHSDFPILKPDTRPAINYLTQGCTTMVTGNCGGGQLNVKDYLSQIDQPGAGTNIVHLIPHGALRASRRHSQHPFT